MALHVLQLAPAGRFALPIPKLEKEDESGTSTSTLSTLSTLCAWTRSPSNCQRTIFIIHVEHMFNAFTCGGISCPPFHCGPL